MHDGVGRYGPRGSRDRTEMLPKDAPFANEAILVVRVCSGEGLYLLPGGDHRSDTDRRQHCVTSVVASLKISIPFDALSPNAPARTSFPSASCRASGSDGIPREADLLFGLSQMLFAVGGSLLEHVLDEFVMQDPQHLGPLSCLQTRTRVGFEGARAARLC